jgi:aryl-alcohol dehydrogenase-like predicted oxidoreductase
VGAKLCEAHAAGVSVLIKEAMANGRLTPRNTAPGFEDRLALLSKFAAENDTTVDALALACVMRQEFRPVVLSGASTVGMMQANAAAMELAGRIDAATVEQLCQALVQSPEEYWTERGSLAWN